MLPNEVEVFEEIHVRYAPQLAAMTALHDVVVGMMTADSWTIRRTSGTKPFTIDVLRGLLTKACKTFRAIQLLCERGLHEDANALVRVLLETTVAVLFILQRRRRDKKTNALTPTSQHRAVTYYAHSLHQQLKMLREWRETPGLKRQAPKQAIRNTEDTIASVTSHLPVGTDFRAHWSGKGGLQQAVRALRADPLYAVLYRYTSAISHVTDVGGHFEADPVSGDLVWQVAPRADGIEGPCAVARELLWLLANRIDERLGLGFDAALAPHKLRRSDFLVQSGTNKA